MSNISKRNKLLLYLILSCVSFGILYINNSYADTVTITKDGTEKVDYQYGNSCSPSITSRYKVTYNDGRSYKATCIDPVYATPGGTGTVVDKNNENLKKVLLVMNSLGDSTLINAFKKTSDWGRLYKSQSDSQKMCKGTTFLRNGMNHAFTVGHAMASYANGKGCLSIATAGVGSLSCSTEMTKLNNFFNNTTYAALLNQYVVKSVPRTSNQQEIAWLEPAAQPESTSTNFISTSTVERGSSSDSASSSSDTTTSRIPDIEMASNATDPISITFKHTIKRDSDTTIATAKTKWVTSNTLNGNPATGTELSLGVNGEQEVEKVTVTVSPDSSTTSTDTSGNSLKIAPGGSMDICRYVKFSPTVYNSDATGTGTGNSGACVKVTRKNPTVSTSTATFSGSVSITEANGASGISCSGDTCTATRAGTYNFTRVYSVTRTDSNSAAASIQSRYEASGSEYKSITASSPLSAAIAYNASQKTVAVKTETTSVTLTSGGTDQTICGYLSFDQTINLKTTDGSTVETGRDSGGRAYRCITIKAPTGSADATFSGSVSITEANGASGISCTGDTCTATQPGTYSFSRVYKVTRTDSNSASPSTKVRYSVSGSSYESISSSSPLSSAISIGNSSAVSSDTTTATVTRGGYNQTICGYLSFDKTVTYKIEQGSTTETSRDSSGRAYRCITIVAPPATSTATFAGSVSITEANGASGISCSGDTCTATQPGTYYFSRVYKVTRTDSDTNAPATKARFATSPSSYQTINTSSSLSSALSIKGSVAVKSDTPSVTMTRGGSNQNICGYLSYDQTVNYKTQNGATSETDRDSSGRTYRCITIVAPEPYDYADFSGNVIISNADGMLSGSASSGFTGTAFTTSYTMTIVYQLKRDDRDAPGTGTSRYVLSSSSQPTSYSGNLSISINKGDTSWHNLRSETVTVNVPSGSSKTICAYLSYDDSVAYLRESLQERSFNGRSKQCATITNPSPSTPYIYELGWKEYETNTQYEYIKVRGETSLSSESDRYLIRSGGYNNYITRTINVSAIFDNQLIRSNDGFSYDTDSVSTNYSIGSAVRKNGTSGVTARTLIYNKTSKRLYPGERYTVEQTRTTYDRNSLKAGEKVYICHQITHSPYKWRVRFADIRRRYTVTEYYSVPVTTYTQDEEGNTIATTTYETHSYQRTIDEPVQYHVRRSQYPEVYYDGDQDDRAACIYVERPYNYDIDEIVYSGRGSTENFSYTGNAFNPQFQLKVKKDNEEIEYISDMNNPDVAVVGLVIDKDLTIDEINDEDDEASRIIKGGTAPSSSSMNLCSRNSGFYRFIYRSGSEIARCEILKEGKLLTSRNSNNIYSENEYTVAYNTSEIQIPKDVPAGSKFCVAIAVKSRSSSDNRWQLSKAACTSVAKNPTFEVWGGSVLARGGINVSHRKFEDNYYGSWGDFSLISKNSIVRMASGAALSNGFNSDKVCDYSPLTISNKNCSSGSLGGASRVNTPDIGIIKRAMLQTGTNLSGKGETTTNVGNTLYFDKESSVFSIPTSTRGESTTLRNTTIYYSDRDIEITGDIITEKSGSVPTQVVVISDKDILIDSSVQQIDAWLIAGGTIHTCTIDGSKEYRYESDHYYNDYVVSICSNQLFINGPIKADKIVLNRTYGADTSNEDGEGSLIDPAERIDLNAAYYIWAYDAARQAGQPTAVYFRELPPRY